MSFKKNIKNALISVSDKKNLLKIAKILLAKKINLLTTNGTGNFLKKNNIPIVRISDYVNFPEIMNGRLKTLHPKIMAGILSRREKDQKTMMLYNLSEIDIVIVNFYPFEKVEKEKNNIDEIIENIDIGGPTLVRAAAKNYKNVIVLVDLSDLEWITDAIKNDQMCIKKRFFLAKKAFEYTSNYEKIISNYFTKMTNFQKKLKDDIFPNEIKLNFIKKQNLRYGENQHQKSSFYVNKSILQSGTISSSYQQQGKNLSYNNVSDADIALECVKEFFNPACVIVKHGNPCGVSEGNSIFESYLSAYNADPVSSFGGIIAFNDTLDFLTTQEIIKKQFVEVIIAPKINIDALQELEKRPNIRILTCGKIKKINKELDFKRITNGMLIQEYDHSEINLKKFSFVTKRIPTSKELKDAIFCWKVSKFVKSNAIVYGLNQTTISIGAGQTSRIDATNLANFKAKNRKQNTIGAVMASDAFFPFRDGIDSAASIGINCIIQPGGSINDQETIQAANEYKIAMIFTNKRHFKH